jgi:hypothetical protein
MKTIIKISVIAALMAVVIAGCQKDPELKENGLLKITPAGNAAFEFPQPDYPVTYEGIVPGEFPGNFVSSDDDQVCYDMSALGYIGEVTSEMRGFKIDPPTDYNDGNVDVLLSADGKFLAWAALPNTSVLAFILKGGPNYHVYDYVEETLNADSWLASPLNRSGNIPKISHYNLCYEFTPGVGNNGCTPGYWRNHANRWEGFSPGQNFDYVFGVTYLGTEVTLGMAVDKPNLYGTFAFHAVAALLNSTGGVPNADGTTVDYAFTTQQVIDMVKAAVNGGDIEATKNMFETENEKGCPLSGTKAVKVS